MGFAREFHWSTERYRTSSDPDPDIAQPPRPEPAPGKTTQVERMLAQLEGRARWAGHPDRPEPGRRTLIDDAQPPRLGFDDYRVLGLRDVLQQLGPDPVLRAATIAAAAAADRTVAGRATLWRDSRSGPATTNGQAMWQAAERHAVTLYRKAVGDGAVDPADPALEAALQRRGAGQPLPAELRRAMERELAVSLAGVRIHSDAVAAAAARAVSAEAFTVGEDIFFAEHAYAPDTPAGRMLLAHELTHVVQRLRGEARSVHGLQVSRPGDPLEREADAMAGRVADRMRPAPAVAVDHVRAAPPARAAQRAPTSRAIASGVTPHEIDDDLILDPAIGASPAMALPATVRAQLETALGVELGGVTLHEQPRLGHDGIRALTRGSTVYFARGEYAPDKERGLELLAHELVHVAQPGPATAARPGLVRVSNDRAAEGQAEQVAAAVAREHGGPVAWTPVPAIGEAHAAQGTTRQWSRIKKLAIRFEDQWYLLPELRDANGDLFDWAGSMNVEFEPPGEDGGVATVTQIVAYGKVLKSGEVKVGAGGQHVRQYQVGELELATGTTVQLTWTVTGNATVGEPEVVESEIVKPQRKQEVDAPADPSKPSSNAERRSSSRPKKRKRLNAETGASTNEQGEASTEPLERSKDERTATFSQQAFKQVNKTLGTQHGFASNRLMPYEGSKGSIRNFVLHELVYAANNQGKVERIVEPFMGAGTIFFNWPQSELEMSTHIMGDINRHGIDLFEALRDLEANELKDSYDQRDTEYESNKRKQGVKQAFDAYLETLNDQPPNPIPSETGEDDDHTANHLPSTSDQALRKATDHIYFSEMTRQGIHQDQKDNWVGTFEGGKQLKNRKQRFGQRVDTMKQRFDETKAIFYCQDWKDTLKLAEQVPPESEAPEEVEEMAEVSTQMELETRPPAPGTIVYCDSPYPKSNTESDTVYGTEFTMQDLGVLLAAAVRLANAGVSVVVSNYHNPDSAKLLDTYPPTMTFVFPVVHQGKTTTEMLLIYAPPATALHQSEKERRAHLDHLASLAGSGRPPKSSGKRGRPRKHQEEPEPEGGNCLYDAVREFIGGEASSVEDLRRIATDWVLENRQLHQDLQEIGPSLLGALIDVLVTPGRWYGEQEAGNLAPKVLASILGYTLVVVSVFGGARRVYRVTPYGGNAADDLTIFFHDNHYTAYAQDAHQGWDSWEVIDA